MEEADHRCTCRTLVIEQRAVEVEADRIHWRHRASVEAAVEFFELRDLDGNKIGFMTEPT